MFRQTMNGEKKNSVVLYGIGNYADKKIEKILEQYQVDFCVDSVVKTDATKNYRNYIVYNPQKLGKVEFDYVILLSHKWYEMYCILRDIGIDENKIIFGSTIEPALDSVEEYIIHNNIRLSAKGGGIKICADDKTWLCTNEEEYRKWCRNVIDDGMISAIKNMDLRPLSKRFGAEFGTPIDRVYIERFIDENRKYIKGTVMEIAEPKYAKKYTEAISKLQILHVEGWGENVIKGNFVTGEGIIENSVDCLICTQTLLCVYEIKKAIANIYKCLNHGGTAIITIPGITQISLYDYRNWGQYWAFTEMSMRQLFGEYFDEKNIYTKVYGNVKTAMGFLYGLPAEEFTEEDFDYTDEQYQVIIGVKVEK